MSEKTEPEASEAGNELQELVKKLNMASGIFVNKKV